MIKLLQGDCLIESKKIKSGSVDLILTDLPYGTVQGIGGNDGIDHGMAGKTEWDVAIEPARVYDIANRILRKNGKMVLFSQEPYTTRLITEAIPNLPFSYRMIWEKDHFANSLIAKKAPVSYYEDILVFSKRHDTGSMHPLRAYGKKCSEFISKSRQERKLMLGHRGSDHFLENSSDPLQFSLCTEKTYKELVSVFKLNTMDGFMPYDDLRAIDKSFDSTFNLWDGGKHKSNIFRYKKDYDGYHPTQKPVALLEDLIKTFSNEGDLVVDLTMGSGSTCVAAKNTGRSFIGIEKEKEYVDIANERIKEHTTQTDMFDVLEGE